MTREPTARTRYGMLPSQFFETWSDPDGRARGLVVSLHGGWWRAQHDLHLNDRLCSALAADGWLVGNVEYRRIDGDGGGWPQTLTDVLEAVDALMRAHPEHAEGPVVTIGHSAGGHLALLAAAHDAVSAAIALAPVTDLPRCLTEQLGEGATTRFLADTGERAARQASPLHRLPLGVPQLIVHGDQDQRVPVEHSRDYLAAARATRDEVEYAEVPGADHFQVIDPAQQSFSPVRTWLDTQFGR